MGGVKISLWVRKHIPYFLIISLAYSDFIEKLNTDQNVFLIKEVTLLAVFEMAQRHEVGKIKKINSMLRNGIL